MCVWIAQLGEISWGVVKFFHCNNPFTLSCDILLFPGIKCFASRLQCYSTLDQTADTSDGKGTQNDEKAVRESILAASLPFVPAHGWSREALGAGAESVGLPGVAHGMFPRGGVELVQFFYVSCNAQLVKQLREEADAVDADPSKKKPPAVFFADAVECRLRMLTPYLDQWPQAIGILSLPPNVPNTLANLLTLVDDICYYAGDRSVDFSWYTRRVTLAGVYKMTELCMVQDKSEDFAETWRFLGRRIADVDHLHQYLSQSGEVSNVAKETVTSVFITARNILGLNLGNR